MCYLKPLKVCKIAGNTATLENGIKAYIEKKAGKIEINDLVLVYGNLILEKVEDEKQHDN